MAHNIKMTSVQLRSWRTKNGFSQNQLADILSVDVSTVSRWERGVREIPPFLHIALERVAMKGGGFKKQQKERKQK